MLLDHITVLSSALVGETVAVNWILFPTTPVFLPSIIIFSAFTVSVTVTLIVSLYPPSTVVTVIVALPGLIPVITPVDETFAIFVSELFQTTSLFVALVGRTVAVTLAVLPTLISTFSLLTLIPVTAISFSANSTVILTFAVNLPSFVVTVIVAVPSFNASTLPFLSTITTSESLLSHVNDLSFAFSGLTVATKVVVSPGAKVIDFLFNSTPVTLTNSTHLASNFISPVTGLSKSYNSPS